jgi:hypothetical protein
MYYPSESKHGTKEIMENSMVEFPLIPQIGCWAFGGCVVFQKPCFNNEDETKACQFPRTKK